MFSPGVIILWIGTNASIPAGWARETDLDAKYPKAQGVDTPGTSGGAATHTHSSPSHTHALNAHTHTYTLTDLSPSGSTGATDNGANHLLACEHYHTGSSGSAVGGTTSGTAVTYGAFSNDPPYYGVIFIKSTGYNFFLPADASVLWDSASIPTGLSIHNGADASPNLANKYLKGATTGADSGTTGGTYTNTHDISHTNTAQTHTHASATSSGVLGECYREGGSTPNVGMQTHTHTVELNAGTESIDAYSGSLVTTETVEPSFRKLLAVKNTSGAQMLATVGTIALWKDSLATIPVGWTLYTNQNDYHLKIASNTGEIGNTGGSNTHTHAAQSHTHTSGGGGHTHATATISSHVGTKTSQNSGSVYDQTISQHSLSSASTQNPGYASANTTADSSNNEPAYNTMAYIKLDFLSGGAMLALF